MSPGPRAIGRIACLWRGQAGWLLAGLALSVAAAGSAALLMALAARLAAGHLTVGRMPTADAGIGFMPPLLAAPILIRLAGPMRVGLRYLERLLTHDATFRALAALRVWFFRNLAARAAGGLGFRHAGDMLARLVDEVEALDGLYLRVAVPAAGALLFGSTLVWLCAHRGPWLAAWVGGCFALAAIGLPAVAARMSARRGGVLAEAGAGLRIAALDAADGLREIRAYGLDARTEATVAAREAALLAAQAELADRGARIAALALLCGQAAILGILATVGGWSHPAGAVVAVFVAVTSFEAASPLARAGVLAGRIADAAGRVLAVADTDPSDRAPPDPARPRPPPADTHLRFETVRFGWRTDQPVFESLTLDLPPGCRAAVIGPSGAGKSTLAALAMRLAAPTAGRVTLGGADLGALAGAVLRRRVVWLGQATHLFDDSIRANLLLARPDADDAALWAALDQAAIGELVRGLPDGLDTWVGEAGFRFSGGQGRRLALARALLSPAPILILDEPCAGLDAGTERAFLKTFYTPSSTPSLAMPGMPPRTTLLIAHRLTGAERLDRVWRLQDGRAIRLPPADPA